MNFSDIKEFSEASNNALSVATARRAFFIWDNLRLGNIKLENDIEMLAAMAEMQGLAKRSMESVRDYAKKTMIQVLLDEMERSVLFDFDEQHEHPGTSFIDILSTICPRPGRSADVKALKTATLRLQGKSNDEIAGEIEATPRTVQNHISTVRELAEEQLSQNEFKTLESVLSPMK